MWWRIDGFWWSFSSLHLELFMSILSHLLYSFSCHLFALSLCVDLFAPLIVSFHLQRSRPSSPTLGLLCQSTLKSQVSMLKYPSECVVTPMSSDVVHPLLIWSKRWGCRHLHDLLSSSCNRGCSFHNSSFHKEWVGSSLCKVSGVHQLPWFISYVNSSLHLPRLDLRVSYKG
jgi:hypothetical protein